MTDNGPMLPIRPRSTSHHHLPRPVTIQRPVRLHCGHKSCRTNGARMLRASGSMKSRPISAPPSAKSVTPRLTDTSAFTLLAVVSKRALIRVRLGVTNHATSKHPKHTKLQHTWRQLKDKTDKLFKPMITPIINLSPLITNLIYFSSILSFINDAWLVRFLSWLRVTTQLTGRSGTGENVFLHLKLINPKLLSLKLSDNAASDVVVTFLPYFTQAGRLPNTLLHFNGYNWELAFSNGMSSMIVIALISAHDFIDHNRPDYRHTD